jgi:hypothetical protein
MEWEGEKQARLDTLRAAELSGTLELLGQLAELHQARAAILHFQQDADQIASPAVT